MPYRRKASAGSAKPKSKDLREYLQRNLEDFGHLAFTRHMFEAFQNAAGGDPWIRSRLFPFQLWLVSNYMITCIAALRRQSDSAPDAVSLANFLATLVERPEKINRSDFKSLYPLDMQDKADSVFDELVGQGTSALTKRMVGVDKTAFGNKVKSIHGFATNRIAHQLDNFRVDDVMLEQINECADLALAIFQKYLALCWGPEAPTINRPMDEKVVGTLKELFGVPRT